MSSKVDVNCKDCEYFEKKRCHRYPPSWQWAGFDTGHKHPQVDEGDWCGESKVKA